MAERRDGSTNKMLLASFGVASLVCAFGGARSLCAQEVSYDVAITNGRVMDPESNLDAIRNVGISGGKIREVSQKELRGKETIEAHGLVVTPGFIDLHQHGQDPKNYEFKARDGVTTSR